MSRTKTHFDRPAFSLIEMAVAISILSVVLALSMTTIVALFRAERQFAADASHDLAIARLALQFRADAHHATSATLNNGCEFQLSDGQTIQYTFVAPSITREVGTSNQTEHRDSFVIHRHATAAFSFAADSSKRLMQLSIAPTSDAQLPRSFLIRPVTLEAALNLYDQRNSVAGEP